MVSELTDVSGLWDAVSKENVTSLVRRTAGEREVVEPRVSLMCAWEKGHLCSDVCRMGRRMDTVVTRWPGLQTS